MFACCLCAVEPTRTVPPAIPVEHVCNVASCCKVNWTTVCRHCTDTGPPGQGADAPDAPVLSADSLLEADSTQVCITLLLCYPASHHHVPRHHLASLHSSHWTLHRLKCRPASLCFQSNEAGASASPVLVKQQQHALQ